MKRRLVLSEETIGLCVELLQDHRRAVERGETVTDQPKKFELEDVDTALDELRGEKASQR